MFELIEEWARVKGIGTADSLFPQFCKVTEEIGEIAECINKGKKDKLEEEIGDAIITLTILAQQAGLDARSCVSLSYEKIKNRKGETVNGVFVKEKSI